jgi:hypothetical protein
VFFSGRLVVRALAQKCALERVVVTEKQEIEMKKEKPKKNQNGESGPNARARGLAFLWGTDFRKKNKKHTSRTPGEKGGEKGGGGRVGGRRLRVPAL